MTEYQKRKYESPTGNTARPQVAAIESWPLVSWKQLSFWLIFPQRSREVAFLPHCLDNLKISCRTGSLQVCKFRIADSPLFHSAKVTWHWPSTQLCIEHRWHSSVRNKNSALVFLTYNTVLYILVLKACHVLKTFHSYMQTQISFVLSPGHSYCAASLGQTFVDA